MALRPTVMIEFKEKNSGATVPDITVHEPTVGGAYAMAREHLEADDSVYPTAFLILPLPDVETGAETAQAIYDAVRAATKDL